MTTGGRWEIVQLLEKNYVFAKVIARLSVEVVFGLVTVRPVSMTSVNVDSGD